MEKLMPLDLLSSIKGARSSDAVSELFKVIQKAVPENQRETTTVQDEEAVSPDSLREDRIERCPDADKQFIKKNFPKEKNGYLVVPKVIED